VHTRASGESGGERTNSITGAQEHGGTQLFDPAGLALGSVKPAGAVESVRAQGIETSNLTSAEMFARLDAESPSRPVHWVQAGAHHAEAGYLDPALGWVGVRAEASGNAVHAAVLPGSTEAAHVLGTHLAGLNAFLSEHHGQHATATLAAPEERAFGSGGDRESGAEQESGRGNNTGSDAGAQTAKLSNSAVHIPGSAGKPADESQIVSPALLRGAHVSVMA
jgi:hypothetical protein